MPCSRRLNKKHSTRSVMAGLFFCLASAEGVGLLFCHFAIQPHTSVYSGLCSVHANYTAHATKQRTGLYSGFSCNYVYSTVHDTRPTQADIMPLAPRWRAYTRPDALNRYQIPPPRRNTAQVCTAAYYNKVYKGATDRRPCQPGSGLYTSHARRLAVWHRVSPAPSTRRGIPAAGGAEPLTATAVSLFGLSPDSQ